jgi:hypothetical protein
MPDRPFDDDDVQSLSQKFVVVVDAQQYGDDGDLTFETPFIPQMNEFYGRHFYYDYDAARAQLGSMGEGAVGIITSISTQRLEVRAYNSFDWMARFFALCKLVAERSEPGLRCKRLINQFGGLQDCRVLKIRGVRDLLRKYGVDQSFTRSSAIECIRDIDAVTGAVGFEAFKNLHITYPQGPELKPDDVLTVYAPDQAPWRWSAVTCGGTLPCGATPPLRLIIAARQPRSKGASKFAFGRSQSKDAHLHCARTLFARRLSQRWDGWHLRQLCQVIRIQPKDLRIMFRISIGRWLGRAPRIETGVTTENGPNTGNR